jgi:hypothetical protein
MDPRLQVGNTFKVPVPALSSNYFCKGQQKKLDITGGEY